jgi:hypothetical protein
MKGVAAVESVPLEGPWRRMSVMAQPGAPDLRECIGSLLKSVDATVRELSRETPTLEHLFVRMSAEAETADATGDGHLSGLTRAVAPPMEAAA